MRCIVWLMLASAILLVNPEPSTAKSAPPAPDKPAITSTTLPEIITLETSKGTIVLPHLAHAKRFHCNTCHSEVEPGKIAWDKETAHSYCRDCHIKKGGGPTTCGGCHKK